MKHLIHHHELNNCLDFFEEFRSPRTSVNFGWLCGSVTVIFVFSLGFGIWAYQLFSDRTMLNGHLQNIQKKLDGKQKEQKTVAFNIKIRPQIQERLMRFESAHAMNGTFLNSLINLGAVMPDHTWVEKVVFDKHFAVQGRGRGRQAARRQRSNGFEISGFALDDQEVVTLNQRLLASGLVEECKMKQLQVVKEPFGKAKRKRLADDFDDDLDVVSFCISGVLRRPVAL